MTTPNNNLIEEHQRLVDAHLQWFLSQGCQLTPEEQARLDQLGFDNGRVRRRAVRLR